MYFLILLCCNYLGVTLTGNIDPKPQLNQCVKRMSNKIFNLGRLRRIVPEKTCIEIYLSMIQPLVEYCSFVIGSCCSVKPNLGSVLPRTNRTQSTIELFISSESCRGHRRIATECDDWDSAGACFRREPQAVNDRWRAVNGVLSRRRSTLVGDWTAPRLRVHSSSAHRRVH